MAVISKIPRSDRARSSILAEYRLLDGFADEVGASSPRCSRHKLVVVEVTAESDFDRAFISLVQARVAALFVEVDAFFTDQRAKIVALAAQYALPAIYALREFVDSGGLISYGTSITDANRQLGVYTGRILKGAKPAELPVMQSTRFELVVNLKAAKSLGLDLPTSILLLADEVIE